MTENKKNERPKFEFKKIDNDKYAFVMHSPDIERTEVVSKDYVKQHYVELENQRINMMENLKTANKMIEQTMVEKDDELEQFIALANKAAKYNKYLDSVSKRDSALEMLHNIEESIKLIKTTLPEVERMKK